MDKKSQGKTAGDRKKIHSGCIFEYTDLLTGRIPESDFEKIVVLSEEFKRLPYQIEEASCLPVEGIRAKLERMNDIAEQSGEPTGVLVVDYLRVVALPRQSRCGGRRNLRWPYARSLAITIWRW